MGEAYQPGWRRGVRTDAERGPGIRTHTGWFYPMTPRAEDVGVRDIAHALAMLCRFGGHVRSFYSVAQHSVLVSHHVPREMMLVGLLHDAAEAYVGDMVSPIKRQLPAFSQIEDGVWCAIVERFDLTAHGVDPVSMAMPPEIKKADLRALVTEQRDLWSGPPRERSRELRPFQRAIRGLDWRKAELSFLNRWRDLTGERVLPEYDPSRRA